MSDRIAQPWGARTRYSAGQRWPDPPQIICVNSRETPVAKAATVHLAPVPGTDLALMNGLLHEVITHDRVDHDYPDAPSITPD